jgi:lysophospholipase L1-like esterase
MLCVNGAQVMKRITYIDILTPMMLNGVPREEMWIEDGVHRTPAGYKLWAEILRPYLT